MKTISKYPILILTANLVVNILLAFFLILILADGILEYKVGFVVNIPIVGLILITLIFTYLKYFNRQNSEIRNTLKTIVLIILGVMILLIYSFNILCWVDLFDGKKKCFITMTKNG